MTAAPDTLDLLKRAEALLSALHGSVARHDNLAANLGCAGCELRDQISAALPSLAVAPAVLPPATDRAASYRHAADAIESMQGYPHLILPEEIVAALRLLAAGEQPDPGSPAYIRRPAAGERDEQQAQQDRPETREWHRTGGFDQHDDYRTDVPAAAPVAGQPPADRLHCPRCQEDITDYAEDDFVFRTGDERPYCSGECVVAAHRAGLPTEQPPADTTGEEAQPRFVRVCIACPQCDHTLDESGACANGCTPPAVAAEPGKEADNPRSVCVCGHTRGEHVVVSGRLLCDECDPDSTDNLVCKEFEAL